MIIFVALKGEKEFCNIEDVFFFTHKFDIFTYLILLLLKSCSFGTCVLFMFSVILKYGHFNVCWPHILLQMFLTWYTLKAAMCSGNCNWMESSYTWLHLAVVYSAAYFKTRKDTVHPAKPGELFTLSSPPLPKISHLIPKCPMRTSLSSLLVNHWSSSYSVGSAGTRQILLSVWPSLLNRSW